jgi:hypothetical protein
MSFSPAYFYPYTTPDWGSPDDKAVFAVTVFYLACVPKPHLDIRIRHSATSWLAPTGVIFPVFYCRDAGVVSQTF